MCYNGHYLGPFLQAAGYSTRYTGKLMNGHTHKNFDSLAAQGWTESAFLLDPTTYDYWNPHLGINNTEMEYHAGEYSTDVIAAKALELIENAAGSEQPFFVGSKSSRAIPPAPAPRMLTSTPSVAPIAPHSHMRETIPPKFDIPQSAPRHQHLFQDVYLNYSRESHNPDVPSGVSWVRELEQLNSTVVEYIQEFYRQRLRALQAVDELVAGVVNKLDELGELDNTIIIYTSDNGFEANAGHRRQPGKTLPYEEDINVPLVVRGPNVPKGLVDSTSVYSLADLGATILHLAGGATDYENDGALLPLTAQLRESVGKKGIKQHHLAEYWVEGADEGKYGVGLARVNQTYRAVRVVEGDENYSYAVWCTGEHELYDLTADPDQMDNLAEPSRLGHLRPAHLSRLSHRLDALLLVLKTCVGDVCREPWLTVFPDGSVTSLAQALDRKYDEYFEGLPKVQYSYCDIGYHRRLEHPFWHEDLAFDKRSRFVLQGQL